MGDLPERIWAADGASMAPEHNRTGQWWSAKFSDRLVEYIRADLHRPAPAQDADEVARLREALRPFAMLDFSTTQDAWEAFFCAPGRTWVGYDDIDRARAALSASPTTREGE